MKILLLGLGNPILSDDGVGVQIAASVAAILRETIQTEQAGAVTQAVPACLVDTPLFETFQWRTSPGTEQVVLDVAEASVGGLRLMETLVGYDYAIIVDAMLHPSVSPGAFRRLTVAELANLIPNTSATTEHTSSAHDVSLDIAMNMAKHMGLSLPSEIVLYAVGAQDVLTFSETLTSAVAPVVTDVTRAILADLDNLLG